MGFHFEASKQIHQADMKAVSRLGSRSRSWRMVVFSEDER